MVKISEIATNCKGNNRSSLSKCCNQNATNCIESTITATNCSSEIATNCKTSEKFVTETPKNCNKLQITKDHNST